MHRLILILFVASLCGCAGRQPVSTSSTNDAYGNPPSVARQANYYQAPSHQGQPKPEQQASMAQEAPPEIGEEMLHPAQILAIVGDQPIFVGDVLPGVRRLVEQVEGLAPSEQPTEVQLAGMRQLVSQKIDFKLLYLEFLRTIPADKLDEALPNIHRQVDQQFYGAHIEEEMKVAGVNSLSEMDVKLREYGTSLEHLKEEYREQQIARTIVGQKINRFPEVTHEQLLNYYQEHLDDYKVGAKARWEKMTARIDKFPDAAAAERAMVEMGNEVLGGAPFAAVARRRSQGTHADEGGLHDWTTVGSLVSKKLDHAIFTLPVDRMSQIIRDDQGFHILRVIERTPARVIPFTEAQDEIKKTLQREEFQDQLSEMLTELRKKTYVWTVFDGVYVGGKPVERR